MRRLTHLTLILALTFQPILRSLAANTFHKQNPAKYDSKIFASLRFMKSSWKRSPTLSDFVQKSEVQFHLSSAESFMPLLTEQNKNSIVSYTTFGHKVTLESGGKTLTIETKKPQSLTINGIELTEMDFQSQKELLTKIQQIFEAQSKPNSISLMQILFDNLVPNAHADLGWIGFGAIVIAAGLIAFGVHKATKNLSHTKHEVEIKTPNELTINHKVDGSVDATGTLNGNLNTQGLPEKFDLNINVPSIGNK